MFRKINGRRVAVAAAVAAAVTLAVLLGVAWPHFRFLRLFEPLGKNTHGYLEYRHRPTGIVFVQVPGDPSCSTSREAFLLGKRRLVTVGGILP